MAVGNLVHVSEAGEEKLKRATGRRNEKWAQISANDVINQKCNNL
jgi:hypothetical protein